MPVADSAAGCAGQDDIGHHRMELLRLFEDRAEVVDLFEQRVLRGGPILSNLSTSPPSSLAEPRSGVSW